MAMFPAAMFPIVIGINIGETLEGPFSLILVTCSCIVPRPPTPEPNMTPTLDASSFSISIPLSSIACTAAPIAYTAKGSFLFISFFVIYFSGSKSLTSPATFTLKSVVSNFVIFSIPHTPFFAFSHMLSTVLPSGLTTPIPVITHLLDIIPPFLQLIADFVNLNHHFPLYDVGVKRYFDPYTIIYTLHYHTAVYI